MNSTDLTPSDIDSTGVLPEKIKKSDEYRTKFSTSRNTIIHLLEPLKIKLPKYIIIGTIEHKKHMEPEFHPMIEIENTVYTDTSRSILTYAGRICPYLQSIKQNR